MSLHNCVNLWRIISPAVICLMSVSGASAAGDAAKGAGVFTQCQLCHATKKGVNKEGPSLYRVIGRPAGSIANYAYSDAMKAAAAKGLTWTSDMVVKYLANPHQFFVDYLGDPNARNKMVFMLASEQDREDVVAYLQSLPVN
jgi:cytochrome c